MSAKLIFSFSFSVFISFASFSLSVVIHFTFPAFIFKDHHRVPDFTFPSLCFYFKCLCLTFLCLFPPSWVIYSKITNLRIFKTFCLFSYKKGIIYLLYHTQQTDNSHVTVWNCKTVYKCVFNISITTQTIYLKF